VVETYLRALMTDARRRLAGAELVDPLLALGYALDMLEAKRKGIEAAEAHEEGRRWPLHSTTPDRKTAQRGKLRRNPRNSV